jgi:hypothetical protein
MCDRPLRFCMITTFYPPYSFGGDGIFTYKRPPQWWRYFGLLDGAVKQVDSLIAPSRFSQTFHQKMGLNVPIVHLPNCVPVQEWAAEAHVQSYFALIREVAATKGQSLG